MCQAHRQADLFVVHGEQKPIFGAEGTPGNGALDAGGRADSLGSVGGAGLHGVESDQHGVALEPDDDAPGRYHFAQCGEVFIQRAHPRLGF